jgi:hypothetical protein
MKEQSRRIALSAMLWAALGAMPASHSQAQGTGRLSLKSRVRGMVKLPKTPIGSASQESLLVTNAGQGPLTGSIGALSAPFTVLAGGGPFTLAPHQSLQVVVKFAPASAGRATGRLVVTSNDPRWPTVNVPILGQGTGTGPAPSPAPNPNPTPSPNPTPDPTPTPTPAPGPSPDPGSATGFGPRQPVGPDVPLSDTEKAAFARRVTVQGRTAAAIQSACGQAVTAGIPVVFLPAGQYQIETTVRVPATLTLLGEGSQTLCQARDRSTQMFVAAGDRIRFTRMKLQGADTTWNDTNGSIGISVPAKQNIRIDHCELLGFMRATDFSQSATAQVDHCSIHHNLRNGYGYGLVILDGAYVLVCDNEFTENRHSLTSNGTVDWSGPKGGMYRHIPGARKTHWEFRYNRINGNSLAQVHLPQVETHPGMDGTLVVENNIFENIVSGPGLRDGCGIIRGNLFRNLTGPQPAAIWIITDTQNGTPVENAVPHDIQISQNTFQNVGEQYRIGSVVNIWIDGQVVPSTRKADAPPPPAIPWLQEMGEDGILHWKPSRS